MVSWPCPWALVPISSAAVPLGLKRISAYSGCAVPAACSIALTMPSPRSLPRFLESAWRAAKPATSASFMAMSRFFSNWPQS